jgi:LytS/YehU family sensor histidine kinase
MNLLYSLIIVFFLELLYYFQQWTKAVNEAAELKKRNVMSQLQLLKDQISPHFLFNSLNSLSSLIRRDPDDAVQFVHRLSGVYRYLLQTNEKDFSELQEELKFLQSYLHLLTTRFGKALQYTIKIDNDYQSFLILPLSLQLLVENAVKHNVVAAYSPLHIWIGNERDYLVVKNNLQKKKSKAVSHGVGLTNILSKYKLFTDRKVEIIETEDYFTVKLPLVKETNHESLDR